jgi:hypothetical protein
MPRKLLPIIDSPAGHIVLEKPPGDISPYQGQWGDMDLLCGSCRHTLAEHALPDRSDGIVIRCPVCRAFNLSGASDPEPGARSDAPPPDADPGAVRARDLRHT